MKKIFLIALILAAVLAVGISGCLGNDSNISDENKSAEDIDDSDSTSNETPNYVPVGSTIITEFNGSITTIDPLPVGFQHLATRSVTAHTQGLGIPDAIIGYRNMMVYDEENVYFSVYRCTARTSVEYIQLMSNSHVDKYGSDSIVSTVVINGHTATLLEATVSETPNEGRYILAWTNWSGDSYDDSYLVIVNGKVNYSVIKELAEASGL